MLVVQLNGEFPSSPFGGPPGVRRGPRVRNLRNLRSVAALSYRACPGQVPTVNVRLSGTSS